jgi:hypothetical protein
MLYAKIRSAHSYKFKKGSIVKLVIPSIVNDDGLIKRQEENYFVMLVGKATKKQKYELFENVKINAINNQKFFSQHFWLILHEDEITLALEGFLEPVNMIEMEKTL